MSASVADSRSDPRRRHDGVDVLGFFTAEHGVGEAARSTVQSLRTAGVPTRTINYTDTESRMGEDFPTDDISENRVLFLALNADHVNAARGRMGEEFFRDRYVISQWFWELETAPPWFADAFRHVDELWAPTRFIEEMLRRSAPGNVRVEYMPPAVVAPPVGEVSDRRHFGPDGRFMFYFSFDFMSIAKRKNPVGLIEAYTRAFVPGDGAQLVIKSINGDKRPADVAAVRAAIGDRDDITLMTEYQSRRDASTLMSMADCYVSLHRSEGLGLTITEAMSLGVPVIATGYSGNLDFMDEWNTWRVPCSMVPVGFGAGGYPPGAQWAEPNLDEAARMMREVFENPRAAREKAARAQEHLLNSFSPESAGARMRRRLEKVWASLERR